MVTVCQHPAEPSLTTPWSDTRHRHTVMGRGTATTPTAAGLLSRREAPTALTPQCHPSAAVRSGSSYFSSGQGESSPPCCGLLVGWWRSAAAKQSGVSRTESTQCREALPGEQHAGACRPSAACSLEPQQPGESSAAGAETCLEDGGGRRDEPDGKWLQLL